MENNFEHRHDHHFQTNTTSQHPMILRYTTHTYILWYIVGTVHYLIHSRLIFVYYTDILIFVRMCILTCCCYGHQFDDDWFVIHLLYTISHTRMEQISNADECLVGLYIQTVGGKCPRWIQTEIVLIGSFINMLHENANLFNGCWTLYQ